MGPVTVACPLCPLPATRLTLDLEIDGEFDGGRDELFIEARLSREAARHLRMHLS